MMKCTLKLYGSKQIQVLEQPLLFKPSVPLELVGNTNDSKITVTGNIHFHSVFCPKTVIQKQNKKQQIKRQLRGH